MASAPRDVTDMLAELQAGDKQALDRLLPMVYGELRTLAGKCLRQERSDHTLQATALVHEAYLQLVNTPDRNWQNRAHFFGVAASAMRQILVNHALRRRRLKRGGALKRVTLEAVGDVVDRQAADVLAIDGTLKTLAGFDLRKARVVELRYFGGCTIEDVAEALSISHATVEREWRLARAWLQKELGQEA